MTTQGEVFARAIAARDHQALRAVLADSVAFEALTPGRHWASTDADEVVDKIILGPWFGTHQGEIELCSVSNGQVGDCQEVGYRFRVRNAETDRMVEQQAYYTARDDRIDTIRIVCSGYQGV
ncbi:hypothetical protein [Kutzneria chonburiensis]|uniref:Nuclear transport factor 2 family protein n=1 Tax=Kutzneria chonburiensis TaxID=1483604 RepID=A0ABV6MMP5_9PSEU|nr:hypothetical protein [Kutzneria chonburiensis]